VSEQLVEVNNDCSFQRAVPTKHRNQRMRAVNRFLNPVMKVMCTTSQTSPAIRPESLTSYALRTALRRSTAAMLPKSKYFQGVGSAPFLTRFLMTRAAWRPDNLCNARQIIAVRHVADYEHLRFE
jgi:hypothetical protein